MLSSLRRPLLVALAVAAAISLVGCAPEGERRAAAAAEELIDEIGENLSPPYPQAHDADVLAAEAIGVSAPASGGDVYRIDALDWEGNSDDPDGARITLRIEVSLEARTSNGWFGRGESYEAGRAVRCWVLAIYARNYDAHRSDEIACPDGPIPPPPDPAPREFPDDVDAVLTSAITGATSYDLEARVRDAFPADFFSVRVGAEDGQLAVALGIPEELKCLVAVRETAGTVTVHSGFPKVQLQPGETGCSPDLYFHPVVTH